MPISTQCPHCAAYDSFPDAEAGRSVSCPACGGAIALPLKARPVAAVVAQARPVAAKPLSKPVVDLDDDGDRPRKKSKPIVDLDDEDDERPRKKKSKPAVDLDGDEDRPRKKSKPIVDLEEDEAPAPKSKSQPEFAFDDDADAPSKKKKPRRRDDDEDDEDDRPRRKPEKKKVGKLLLILGAVAFLLLAVCGGGAIFFFMQVDKGLTDLKSKAALPTPIDTTKETPTTGTKPKLKENVQKVSNGESHAALLAKMGPATVATVSDLEDIFNSFEVGTGSQSKADLQVVLDGYAPWVDKGRGLMYRDGANFRALVVFSGVGENKQAWKVHGALWVEQTGNRSEYYERIGFARNPSGDPEAVKLGLKGWKNFRADDGAGGDTRIPAGTVVKISAADLAAELIKDRQAAAKKYAGATLEVTGEVNSATTSGNNLNLKAGIDEQSMKAILIQVVMQLDQRPEAKKLRAGDTVTITGTLAAVPVTGVSFPMVNGMLKK